MITQESDFGVPQAFALHQNYPNPFNPETHMYFEVAQAQYVNMEVFDIIGKKVKTLVSDQISAGSYTGDRDHKNDTGTQLSSGVYIDKMSAGEYSGFERMVLMK